MLSSNSMRWLYPAIRRSTVAGPAESIALSSSIASTSQLRTYHTTRTLRAENSPFSAALFPPSSLPGSDSSNSEMTSMSSTRGSRMGLSKSEPFILHVQATRNNIIMTLTTPQGAPVSHVSSGMVGFKKSARSGYEAGHQTAIKMFSVIEENRLKWKQFANLHLVYNGFGTGREAVHRALLTSEGTVVRNMIRKVSDATRIKIGGVRPKKIRMF